MPRLRDLLARFRPAGAPGAAVAGVPADRSAELTAELQPTLERLGQAQEAAQRMRAAADQEAAEIARGAAADAQRIVAEAQAGAPRVRMAAERAARRETTAHIVHIRADAEEETRLVRAAVEARMPALVELLAERALESRDTPGRTP